MFSRVVVGVLVVVFAVVCSGLAEETKTYSGTFKATPGRKGPITCELITKEAGKWTVNFSAKNEGEGPNREMKCTGAFTGKEEGSKLNLTGEVELQRQGPYTVTAVVEDKTLKATFKQKKEGGSEGSFDLVLGKGEAAAAQPEKKKEDPKPKS